MTAKLNGRTLKRATADVFQVMLRDGPEHTEVDMANTDSLATIVIIMSISWEDIWPQIVDVDLTMDFLGL